MIRPGPTLSGSGLPGSALPVPRPGRVLETSPLLAWAVLLGCAVIILATVVEVPYLGAGGIVVDFDAFYIAGQMAWRGEIAQAYDAPTMIAAQTRLSGEPSFMPWTYPPVFDLLAAALPLAPRGLSYLVFTGGTLAGYVLVLRRLAGPHLTAVLLSIVPALFITIKCGQNGFLTGALAGLFCLAVLRGRAAAGVPLGLMLIKPHLAVGMVVLVLAKRRWKTLGVTVAVAVLTSGAATLAFGPAVWPAFLGGAAAAGGFLERGLYPLYRMTSLYAALRSLGAPAGAALAAQVVSAVLACAAIVHACLRGGDLRRTLGIAALATLAVSPYNYDYDMPILGIGLALLMPDILDRARPAEKAGLFILAWLTCGWGQFVNMMTPDGAVHEAAHPMIALGGLGYVLFLGLTAAVLRRTPPEQALPRA